MDNYMEGAQQVYHQSIGHDSKLPLEILVRLQVWVGAQFKQLTCSVCMDSSGGQYLSVTKATPHPFLATSPSLRLVCRVTKEQELSCSLHSYNTLILKELTANLDSEEESSELKSLLATMNSHSTSICRGIPEEKLLTWATRKNLSRILLERFTNKIVFRDRACRYVMLETDNADICTCCALLLSTSSMDLIEDQELSCHVSDCGRTFKYQGALEKHIQKHELEDLQSHQQIKRPKLEEGLEGIKLEPSTGGNGSSDPDSEAGGEERLQDESDFLDKLLSDLDGVTQAKKNKKRLKPTTKDFNCLDCGKAFYFQKNLFTHVVEKHGKSISELPNLDDLNEKQSLRVRKKAQKKTKGGKDKPVVCDECGVAFKFASGLYNHRKRMHGDIEKKQCPHCDKEVKACTLDQHIREEHGTPRFACQFCGKGFYYKSFMLNHQRLHTGDYKECVCDLCGAVYKSVQVLNRHVRNAHQDLRNHKCQHCDKAFHNKQRLERHINSQHTKARIWPCPVCSSRYDRKDNLRTHIRKNHANVLDVESVELHSIENEEGPDLKNGRNRQQQQSEPTINPETGELERVRASAGQAGRAGQQVLQDRSMHVAHDLLSLKYGEEGGGLGQYRTLTLAATDIKPEVVQYSNYGTVKLERPEIVMTGPGLGQVVKALSRDSLGLSGRESMSIPDRDISPHQLVYNFPTQQDQ